MSTATSPLPLLLTRLLIHLHTLTLAQPTTPRSGQGIPDTARPALLALHLIYPHLLLDALDLLDRGCVIRFSVFDGEIGEGGGRGEGEGEGKQDVTGRNEDGREAGVLTQQRNEIVDEMAADDSMDVDPASSSPHHPPPPPPPPNPNLQPPLLPTHSINPQHAPERRGHTQFHVLSAVPPPSRFSKATSTTTSTSVTTTDVGERDPTSKTYAVHTLAWNCSCPAFAYARFCDAAGVSEDARVRLGSLLSSDSTSNPTPATGSAAGSATGSDTDLGREGGNASAVSAQEVEGLPRSLRWGFGGMAVFIQYSQEMEEGGTGKGGQGLRVEKGREDLPALCKHLLAVVLGESMSGVFVSPGDGGEKKGKGKGKEGDGKEGVKGVVEQWVGREEAAGWSVGGGF